MDRLIWESAGVLELDPGPYTLRKLLTMVRGKSLHAQGFVAQVLQLLANCHRDAKKKKEPFQHGDFMPKKRRRRDRRADEKALDRYLDSLPEK
ncbi:MAG: hypothetical protein K8U03_09210 [Planctomycetia bacterium]|nr:hypothetical protein [Planctomycetia bacterium]